MKQCIYAVDDEKSIRDLYEASFEMAGFDCVTFEGAPSFYEAIARKKPDLILLDIMMPGEDGMMILERLQNSKSYKNIPVIMVSAKGRETDKVTGLNCGASDYLAKPFGILELIARVKANLRKHHEEKEESNHYLDLKVDEEKHVILLKDTTLSLSEKEYQLLSYLISHNNIALNKDTLMNDVWGMDVAVETRTVDMFISKLRRKIEKSQASIETIRSIGYILK